MTRSTRSHIPLRWPDNWPRASSQREGPFSGDRTLTKACKELFDELSRGYFSKNVEITCADGTATPTRHVDAGAAVYFDRAGVPTVLACDKWRDAAHNVWALVLHVRALRGLERWGVGTTSQAFSGYVALPASPDAAPYVPPSTTTIPKVGNLYEVKVKNGHVTSFKNVAPPKPGPWRSVLGFPPKSRPSPEEIDARFKTLALQWHPDLGGAIDAMQILNTARDVAHLAVGSRRWKHTT